MDPVPGRAAAHIVAGLHRLAAANAEHVRDAGRVIIYGQPRLPDEVRVFQVQAHRVRGRHREPEASGAVVVQVGRPHSPADPHPHLLLASMPDRAGRPAHLSPGEPAVSRS